MQLSRQLLLAESDTDSLPGIGSAEDEKILLTSRLIIQLILPHWLGTTWSPLLG